MKTVCMVLAMMAAGVACAVESPRICGHRGGTSEYDDNAKGGFARCLNAGVTAFETDVRTTSDGILVLMHDATVDRTTEGTGTVLDMTAAEVTNLVLTASGEKVPTLASLLELFAGRSDVFVEFEMKTSITSGSALTNYCQTLYQTVSGAMAAGTYVFTSFNAVQLQTIKALYPTAPVGLISSAACDTALITSATVLQASHIVAYYPNITASWVTAAKAAGLTVTAWTVNTLSAGLQMRDMGVDIVCTDYPATFYIGFAGSANANGPTALWMGSVSTNWDTTTANWFVNGTTGKFSNYMNVLFTDAASSYAPTLSGAIAAGAVVFSNNVDYVLHGGTYQDCGITNATRFEKWGSGSLMIDGTHGYTGDLVIAEGILSNTCSTVNMGYSSANVTFSPFGSPAVARKISVLTNGTLIVNSNDTTGYGRSQQDPQLTLEVHGGTFRFPERAFMRLGNTLFDNAKIEIGKGLNTEWHNASFTGDYLQFSGTTAYFIRTNGAEDVWHESTGFIGGRPWKPLNIIVDDITGDDRSDVIFECAWSRNNSYPNMGYDCIDGSFIKKGAGTLEFRHPISYATGNVVLAEGTIRMSKFYPVSTPNSGSAFGYVATPHTWTICTNCTLEFLYKDLMGGAYSQSKITLDFEGGTLRVTNGIWNAMGPTIFRNAKIQYLTPNSDWPLFGFNSSVQFSGTNAYFLTTPVNGTTLVTFGKYDTEKKDFDYTDVIVDDITGDSQPDVYWDLRIANCVHWFDYPTCPSHFRKLGAGTLCFTNMTYDISFNRCKYGVFYSTFTGNVEIAEGTLRIQTDAKQSAINRDFGCLGNPLVNRTVSVLKGGTLEYAVADVNGRINSLGVNMTTVVSNGTLRLSDGQPNILGGTLVFYDAHFEYGHGDLSWGCGGFGKKFKLDGTVPYDFPYYQSGTRFSLGMMTGYQATTNLLRGMTEWEVADITKDSQVDVTFRPILRDMFGQTGSSFMSCGLQKTGAGTLRLTAANIYTGDTQVVEGALLIDSPSSTSPVTVKKGGYLGGTGSVPDVTVEDGGGFEAAANQTGYLKISHLALEGSVTVHLSNPTGIKRQGVKVPIFKAAEVTGSPSSVSFTMDGETKTADLKLRAKDGIFYAVCESGTVVMLM